MKPLKLLKKSLFPDSNFGIEDRNLQRATPAHFHDFNELSFVFAGSATHVVDGAEYTLKRGDVFILRGDRVHEIKNTNNFYLVNLIFDRQHFLAIGKQFHGLNGFNVLFTLEPENLLETKFNARFRLKEEELESIYLLLKKLKSESKYNMPWNELIVESLFKIIVVQVCRSFSLVRTPTAEKAMKIGYVVDYIHQNLAESITLENLAEKAEMSVPAFRRLFKKITGKAPIDYLLRTRIDTAAQIMIDENILVQDAGKRVGFNNKSYFVKQFKNIVGITPKTFVKNVVGK